MLGKPLNLYCDLLRSINKEKINSKRPGFSWSINDTDNDMSGIPPSLTVAIP